MTPQQINNLEELSFELSVKYASESPGEEFHPKYIKDKKLFRKLIRSDSQLEKELTSYFKDFSERVGLSINWNAYNAQTMKASIIDDMIDVDWVGEKLNIKVILTKTLIHAIVAGGQMTEQDTGINVGWSDTEPPALKFLDKYTLKLAGDLNETTLDRIKAGIGLSIGNGESQAEATARLADILDNPTRAATIAHTETVRAFTEGRLAVGEQIGADRKQWDATLNACEICDPMDGDIVDMDESFSSGDDAPPAHPNCRCIVNILMPNE